MMHQPAGSPPYGFSGSGTKYIAGGVRGIIEDGLRIVRGRVDTTVPTVLEGLGFSVVRNGVGNVTMTFDLPFSATPTVVATPESDTTNQTHTCKVRFVSVSSVTLQRNLGGVSDQDGNLTLVILGLR